MVTTEIVDEEFSTEGVGEEFVTDILEHYGTKGQQWGIRKSGTGAPSKRSKGSRSSKVDVSTKHLSNDELKKVVERMRLDQQYSELSKGKSKTKVVDGRAFAKKAVDTAGTAVVTAVIAVGSAKIGSEIAKGAAKRATKKAAGG